MYSKFLFIIIWIISIIFLVDNPAYGNNRSLSADALLHNIEKNGNTLVANDLIDNPEKWNFVLTKISTGNQDWLTVANQLKPVTSAANAEALNFAIAHALIANPEAVLNIIGKNFTVDEVCVSPFIEGSVNTEIIFLNKVIKSVTMTKTESLQTIKSACLKNLKLYLKANKIDLNKNP